MSEAMTMQLLGGLFGIVGIVAIAAGSFAARKTKRFLARAQAARGTVMHLVMRSSTDPEDGTVSYWQSFCDRGSQPGAAATVTTVMAGSLIVAKVTELDPFFQYITKGKQAHHKCVEIGIKDPSFYLLWSGLTPISWSLRQLQKNNCGSF